MGDVHPGGWGADVRAPLEGLGLLAPSDPAGATHAFAAARMERRVGFLLRVPRGHSRIQRIVDAIPEGCWHPVIRTDGDRAQLTFTDADRMRVTAILTNTWSRDRQGEAGGLELRHGQHAGRRLDPGGQGDRAAQLPMPGL